MKMPRKRSQLGLTRRRGDPSLHVSQRELFEAFCCAQIERIERTLSRRYGFDYLTHQEVGAIAPTNRYHVMPQNDDLTRHQLLVDTTIETRGSCGAAGPKRSAAR